MTPGERIGIFGGTFNPIHLGHLRAAEEVRETLSLDRVVLVPSAEPPHKSGNAADPIAPPEERLAWVRAAVADDPHLEVDALEIERSGPSYSVDTVREIARRTAPERPVFVIGCDAFVELGSWREPKALLEQAHFAVVTRPPVLAGSLADWLPEAAHADFSLDADGTRARHRSAGTWIRVVPITALDISSSDIRTRIRAGRSVRYLLPEPVRRAIEEQGTYTLAHGPRAGRSGLAEVGSG